MTDDSKIKPFKSYYVGSCYTGIINTWRTDGHQSCQLRLPSDFMKAVLPVDDLGSMVQTEKGNVPKYSDDAKSFATYGTLELRMSDFYALAPVFIALARMNGASVVIDFGKEVPFREISVKEE